MVAKITACRRLFLEFHLYYVIMGSMLLHPHFYHFFFHDNELFPTDNLQMEHALKLRVYDKL